MTSDSTQNPIEHEERTRVFCHLPVKPGAANFKIIEGVVDYLENQRKKSVNLTGYTKTVEFPTVMEGFWRTTTRRQFLREDVVMFIIDYDLTIRDHRLWETVAEIKRFITEQYTQLTGKAEDEVWVVVHSIFRLK